MHLKFTEQKNWSQELKMKVNQYFHKMLESSHGVPEDLIELVNDIIELRQVELKTTNMIIPRRQLLEAKTFGEVLFEHIRIGTIAGSITLDDSYMKIRRKKILFVDNLRK
jgi:hypothetical protein